eukprot:TRINITY_DN50894_c0_g1_i1.p1 TRINITY_DN50894_c0_g1~~TRINITY_DN50894_c0_g1_i1.p1  ORF type:complete len:594 (-),score=129.46 TRINITY_DN50894_c0_g1_i1:213-1853(-)
MSADQLRASLASSRCEEGGDDPDSPEGGAKRRASVSDAEFKEVLNSEGVQAEEEEEEVPIVDRPWFDMVIGGFICVNALVMGLECDLKNGTEFAETAGWVIVDNLFCLVWIGEMVLKLYYQRLRYFLQPWNLLDFLLVLLSIFDAWIVPSLPGDSMDGLGAMRTIRMLRILRLFRLVRLMKMFRNLWLIVSGFFDSLSTLYWVLLLMGLVVYIFGVFLRLTIDCDEQFASWTDCFAMFGTVPRTMYTLFQVITLESWSMAVGRPIFEVQPWFFPVFLCFLFLTTFGLLNIVVGVIVENTLNVAQQNQELQEKRAMRRLLKDLETLRVVFDEADEDGSGTLELEEFEAIMKKESVKAMLARMELPTDDPAVLFGIIDTEETGAVSFTGFTKGVLKVKGPPTGLDMKAMQVKVHGISNRLNNLEGSIGKRFAKVEGTLDKIVANQKLMMGKSGGKKEQRKHNGELYRVSLQSCPHKSLNELGDNKSAGPHVSILREAGAAAPIVTTTYDSRSQSKADVSDAPVPPSTPLNYEPSPPTEFLPGVPPESF